MKKEIYARMISIGMLFSFIVLYLMYEIKKAPTEQQNQFLYWIFLLSIILAVLIILFAAVTSHWKRYQTLSSTLNTMLIMYLGILLIGLSQYKEMIKNIDWDPSMLALGIAIIAFGWAFVMNKLQEDINKKNQEKIESALNTINKSFNHLRKRRRSIRR